jgi:hypothetical protein
MTTRAEEIAGDGPYTVRYDNGRYVLDGPTPIVGFWALEEWDAQNHADDLNAAYRQGQQDRWIPVSESLPEKNEVVIGVGVKWTRGDLVIHGDCEDYDPDTIIGEDSPTETLWRWHSDGTPIRDSNVTHWMSLPPNPEQR